MYFGCYIFAMHKIAYNSSESCSGHISHRNLIRLVIVFVVVCVHIYSQLLHCFSLVRSTVIGIAPFPNKIINKIDYLTPQCLETQFAFQSLYSQLLNSEGVLAANTRINRPQDNRPQDNRPQDNRPQDNRPQDNRPQDNRPQDTDH